MKIGTFDNVYTEWNNLLKSIENPDTKSLINSIQVVNSKYIDEE